MTLYDKIEDFDYNLPEYLIAKHALDERDQCKLLVLNEHNQILDLKFSNIIDFIQPNDLLVLNDTKVIKARLFGNKLTGGKIEILVERVLTNQLLTCHIRSNKHIPIGLIIELPNMVRVEVCEKLEGLFKIRILSDISIYEYLEIYGKIPLPPYINRDTEDLDSNYYQTVYAQELGSVAAPTAGLHFTSSLLDSIKNKGANVEYVTLHVGSGTFKPVSVSKISEHKMHSELYSITKETIDLIKHTKKNGGNVIAVGTTSLRTLEAVANNGYNAGEYETNIFITPGYKFQVVDRLITNFHLPKSTLLMLVSAFAGYKEIKQAYQYAISNEYRFFSYGDSMLLSLNNRVHDE